MCAAFRLATFANLLHDSGLAGTGTAVYRVKASGSGSASTDYKLTGDATFAGQSGNIGRKYRIAGTLAEPVVGALEATIAGQN